MSRVPSAAGQQLALFAAPEHPVLAELRATDVDRLTPLEALQRIAAWREKVRSHA